MDLVEPGTTEDPTTTTGAGAPAATVQTSAPPPAGDGVAPTREELQAQLTAARGEAEALHDVLAGYRAELRTINEGHAPREILTAVILGQLMQLQDGRTIGFKAAQAREAADALRVELRNNAGA